MSKTRLVALAVLLAAVPLVAQETAAAPKAMGAAAKATVTATVVKVDAANRRLSLKDAKGEVVDVSVSPAVKRFAEIKVGDQLNITYMEAFVVGVSKAESSTPLGSSVEQTVEPKKGEKPAGVATRRIKATVAVDSVDMAKREVKVHTSDGNSETFHIQNPKNAEGLKPGDKVTILYEEAVAVEITSPQPKS
jgi:Cu/Ag efflux protein CusF